MILCWLHSSCLLSMGIALSYLAYVIDCKYFIRICAEIQIYIIRLYTCTIKHTEAAWLNINCVNYYKYVCTCTYNTGIHICIFYIIDLGTYMKLYNCSLNRQADCSAESKKRNNVDGINKATHANIGSSCGQLQLALATYVLCALLY